MLVRTKVKQTKTKPPSKRMRKFSKYFIPSTLLCAVALGILFLATGNKYKIIDGGFGGKTEKIIELTLSEAKTTKPNPGFKRYFCQEYDCVERETGKLTKQDLAKIEDEDKLVAKTRRTASTVIILAGIFTSIFASLYSSIKNKLKEEKRLKEQRKKELLKMREERKNSLNPPLTN